MPEHLRLPNQRKKPGDDVAKKRKTNELSTYLMPDL